MSRTQVKGHQIADGTIESADIASGSIRQGELSAQAVSSQSTIASVDTTNDFLLIFDSDSNSLKKVAPTNLGIGSGGGGSGTDTAALQIIDSKGNGAAQTMTATISPDDTIPQITEGTQVLSASITPLSADSSLVVMAHVQCANSSNNVITAALFKDSGSDAIATAMSAPGTGASTMISLMHVESSANTTAREYKVRIGPSGGTLTFQGDGGNNKLGGTLASRITITEILSGSVSTGADRAASYLVLNATSSLPNERVLTAGTGITATDAGAGGALTLAINDSVVATLSGSTFSGASVFNTGLSGSLTHLSDGTSYIKAGTNVTVTSASNGAVTIASTASGGGTTSFLPTGSLYSMVANLSGSGAGMTTYSPAFTSGMQFIPLRQRTISGVRFWANMTSRTNFKFSIWDQNQNRVLTKTTAISPGDAIHEITFDSTYAIPDSNIGKPMYASFYYTEGSEYPRSDSTNYVPNTPFVADQHWVVTRMDIYGGGDSFPESDASEYYMIEPVFATIDV